MFEVLTMSNAICSQKRLAFAIYCLCYRLRETKRIFFFFFQFICVSNLSVSKRFDEVHDERSGKRWIWVDRFFASVMREIGLPGRTAIACLLRLAGGILRCCFLPDEPENLVNFGTARIFLQTRV